MVDPRRLEAGERKVAEEDEEEGLRNANVEYRVIKLTATHQGRRKLFKTG